MNYDPYSNTQTRFERTDRSGRWSPLYEKPSIPSPDYMMWIGGLAFGGAFAILMTLMLFWGI